MGRRAPRAPTGRRTTLTRELAEGIARMVAEGNYVETSARAHGVPPGTLWQWLKQGEDAAQALAKGEQLPPAARLYAEFAEAVAQARARGEVEAVTVVRKVMEGGFLVEEEPLVTKDGVIVYDPISGEMLYKRKYAQPDGKLALEYLSRTAPSRYGRTPSVERVEVTGAGGGALQVEAGDTLVVLAERMAALTAERRAEQLALPEDVVDADVVDADVVDADGLEPPEDFRDA